MTFSAVLKIPDPNQSARQSVEQAPQQEQELALTWAVISSAAKAIMTQRFKQGLTGDPRPDLPDHEYWEKVLLVLYRLDPAFAWEIQLYRLLRARIDMTQHGRLKLDISPMFVPPIQSEMTEDEFKQRFLVPRREILIKVFREVEKEL